MINRVRHATVIKSMIMVVLGLLLASCASTSHVNKNALQSAATSKYINEPMQLKNDMLLVEVKPANPTGYRGYWLFDAPVTTYYNSFIHANIPTLADFQANPVLWQSWQGTSFSDRARVLAVIPISTAFHIVDISRNNSTQSDWVTVQLDASQYKDNRAVFGNPKTLVPGI